MALLLPMIIFAFFGANVIPTSQPQPHTNYLVLPSVVFFGYSAHHKGYHCFDLSFNRLIISRHVVFDETTFPYAERGSSPSLADLDFLDVTDYLPAPSGPVHLTLAGSGDPSLAQPHAAATGASLVGSAALDALPTGPPLLDTPSMTPGVISSPALPRAALASSSPGVRAPTPDSWHTAYLGDLL